MPTLTITLDGDDCWPDLQDKKIGEDIINLMHSAAPPIKLAVLDKGMGSGRPSVTIRLDLPDGRVVLTETSARLFCGAARAIMGRYPDLFEGE